MYDKLNKDMNRQLKKDITGFVALKMPTMCREMPEEFFKSIQEDVISTSDFNNSIYSIDDISLAFQRIILNKFQGCAQVQKQYQNDEFESFLLNALSGLRNSRDVMFLEYNLDKDYVYSNGDFDELPVELLKKVCYVDAYASILAAYKESQGDTV